MLLRHVEHVDWQDVKIALERRQFSAGRVIPNRDNGQIRPRWDFHEGRKRHKRNRIQHGNEKAAENISR